MRCMPYKSIKIISQWGLIWQLVDSREEQSFNDQASYISFKNELRAWYNKDSPSRLYGKPISIVYNKNGSVADIEFDPRSINRDDIHPDYREDWEMRQSRIWNR